MTDWHQARVESTEPAAEELTFLRLKIAETPLVGQHRVPGQYVKLKLADKGESYFAIASAPDPRAPGFDFLLKGGSALADALIAAAPGTPVEVSAPTGKGYPLEQARGKSLLLFATGSGISPIHSVLQCVRRERSAYQDVTLYFGARTPSGFAFAQHIEDWEQKDGIHVIRTVSQPGETGWTGLTGYVQSHLGEVKVDNALAFICGQKGMVQGVTEALLRRGLPKEHIFLNF
ncbi:MAG: NAD-binding oxidoreductase [Myxococcaceae bacterium]